MYPSISVLYLTYARFVNAYLSSFWLKFDETINTKHNAALVLCVKLTYITFHSFLQFHIFFPPFAPFSFNPQVQPPLSVPVT